MRTLFAFASALLLGACAPDSSDPHRGQGVSPKGSQPPSWMGVYGDYERHSGDNPGTFTVLMNQDYYGLEAELGYAVDGGAWQSLDMEWVDNPDGNSLWQVTPPDAFDEGSIVTYYFHGFDSDGAHIWDSNDGSNYRFSATTAVEAEPDELIASGDLPEGADLNQPLQVIFTPDDDALSLELEMIHQLRSARLADEAEYDEGDNPYTVKYAAYNITHDEIADALVEAHEDGVDVQLIVEADKIDTSDGAYAVFDSAGFEIVEDHDTLDASTTLSADLVGIDESGLMHLKARLFTAPDWSALLTGSHNPQYSAMDNDETLHLIRDPELIAEYQAAYDAILAGDELENEWDHSAAVNVLFTPAADGVRAGTRILEWLEEEDELILLMVFALRDITAEDVADSLVEILADKVAAGVPVYVITDRKMSDGINADGSYWFSDNDIDDDLRDAGVPVFEVLNLSGDYNAMHCKAAVLGVNDVRIITDASNWSYSGLGSSGDLASNVESVLFIDSEELDGGVTGQRYLAQWLRILQRYEDQDWGESESWDDIFGELSSLAGWPELEVDFEAHEAHTGWGEVISVRGDADELGAWGPGVELETDGDSYPSWSTAAPVSFPLGSSFAWKLVAGASGASSVSWEGGSDRAGFVSPAALTGQDGVVLEGSWQ